ncbi:hypothetical protein BsWGS_12602 [Bradybaena similaris]
MRDHLLWRGDFSISDPVSSPRLKNYTAISPLGEKMGTVHEHHSTGKEPMNGCGHPDSMANLCVAMCLNFARTARRTRLVTHSKGHTAGNFMPLAKVVYSLPMFTYERLVSELVRRAQETMASVAVQVTAHRHASHRPSCCRPHFTVLSSCFYCDCVRSICGANDFINCIFILCVLLLQCNML